MQITAKERKAASVAMQPWTTGYHNHSPLREIMDCIERHTQFVVAQEDGTEWSGFLLGDEYAATFQLATTGGVFCTNCMLCLQWYKMPSNNLILQQTTQVSTTVWAPAISTIVLVFVTV